MVYCSTAQTQEDWRFPFLLILVLLFETKIEIFKI